MGLEHTLHLMPSMLQARRRSPGDEAAAAGVAQHQFDPAPLALLNGWLVPASMSTAIGGH